MNIGFISQSLPYLPSRGGFRLYGANLIRHLSRKHRVDLVSLLTDGDAEHLDWAQQYCHSVTGVPLGRNRWWTPFNITAGYLWGKPLRARGVMRRILSKCIREWDIIHIEGSYAGAVMPTGLPVGRVLSVHDANTLRCEEMLKCDLAPTDRLRYTLTRYYQLRFQRLLYPRFDRCVVVAPRDQEVVAQVAPKSTVELIPYGTDTDYFYPVPAQKQESTLVFHGHLGYLPNIEAALEFADNIFPRIRREIPNATFHLVGADPVPRVQDLAARPGIHLSANLPDLRPAVCSARVYVCAIRYGTGLKSKVLEAMGMRMPIVCYPGSTVGIECENGENLLVAENPQDFARQVVHLLRHPVRAEQVAEAGRRLVEEKYSWASRAQTYEALYERILQERGENSRWREN